MMRLACAMVLTFAALSQAPPDVPLTIAHRARALTPGEVVVVDVRAPDALQDVRAEWLAQTLVFYQLEPAHWQGLAPLDVTAKAGAHALVIHARTTGGRTVTQRYPMMVAPRVFPSRRLSVDAKFVDPPADALARIEKERQAMEAVFARTTPERLWKGTFVVPVPGAATSSFGRRSILNGQPRSQHTGTDFQAATGTPVLAPNRGRVVIAADHYFPGRTIVIDHGLGLYSYLAHLSRIDVAEGALVERGQPIALSGSTGRVTGPHLHWTMRLGSARVDPLSLVAVLRDGAP